MASDTVRIETIDELLGLAVRLAGEAEAATSMQLMELTTRGQAKRWRELCQWEVGSGAAEVAELVGPYLPSADPLALWARQGRRKLKEVRFAWGPVANALEVSSSALVLEAPPTIEALPVVGSEIQTAHLMLRDQVYILREELASERNLVRELISEALTTGRGSQASLVKLISLQGGLLADAWKVQASAVVKETRRLDALREETSSAEETATAALEEAHEAQASAEQGGQIMAALMQELGPDLIGALVKKGASE